MTVAAPPSRSLPNADFAFQPGVNSGGAWTVIDAHLREALSEVYVCTIDLVSPGYSAQPELLVGHPCAFSITRGGATHRVCGTVSGVVDTGHDGDQQHIRVTVVPALWKLSQRSNNRVFQNLTAVQIVRAVLKDAQIYQGDGERVENLVADAYAEREYCVQFNETDLAFVMRLLEEEGITFYFSHKDESEALVLADSANPGAFRECETLDHQAIPVSEGGASTAATESVHEFDWVRELQSDGVTLRDFNFTVPDATLDMTHVAPRAGGERMLYEYGAQYVLGGYDEGTHTYRKQNGARVTRVRAESIAAQQKVAHGVGNVLDMSPGSTFTLVGHGRSDLDQKYVVTFVEHFAAAHEAVLGAHGSGHERYSNRFYAIPVSTPYRPAHKTARPLALAPQTATVMALPGSHEEIVTDVYGRVLVKFHWDRPELRAGDQAGTRSSCWVRVMQSWAGGGWGTVFTPRVGTEVVVQFLDGNPDRPIVVGQVYNGTHLPPLRLPEERTRSTIRTNSSPGGQGFNELTFEDAAGSEQVYVHAQKDLVEVVRNNHSTNVHVDQSLKVGHDRKTTIDRHDFTIVHGDQSVTIYQNGRVSADESLTLECGASRIVMYPNRIVMTSPTIEIKADSVADIKGGVIKLNS